MSETGPKHQASWHQLEISIRLLHVSQLVLAIVILGLDAYGVRHVKYNVLIFSLVVTVCTIFVCVYRFFSWTVLRKLDNNYVALSLSICMFVFWAVDLGLVASLAMIWGEPECRYNFWDGNRCMPYGKRSVYKSVKTSYGAYYGALVAGACLAAVQVILWIGTISILLGVTRRYRSNMTSEVPQITSQHIDEIREASDPWAGTIPALRNGPLPLLPSPEPGYQSHASSPGPRNSYPRYAMPSPSDYPQVSFPQHPESLRHGSLGIFDRREEKYDAAAYPIPSRHHALPRTPLDP